MIARPPVKWAGGKTRSVEMLKAILPEQIETYYEPMMGGGALFFSLGHDRFRQARINDVNEDLMNVYYVIKHDPELLIRQLSKLKVGKRAFLEIRAKKSSKSNAANAARFIYLNKTCFNGLYRVNKSGQFNVPFGDYKKPLVCDVDNLHACSKVLMKTQIYSYDFATAVAAAKSGDAVYFDPPYIPASKVANFTSYTSGGFTMKDQERLAECFGKLAAEGVAVALTNSDTKLSRGLYKGFEIRAYKAARSINSVAEKRGKVGEIVVVANCRAMVNGVSNHVAKTA